MAFERKGLSYQHLNPDNASVITVPIKLHTQMSGHHSMFSLGKVNLEYKYALLGWLREVRDRRW